MAQEGWKSWAARQMPSTVIITIIIIMKCKLTSKPSKYRVTHCVCLKTDQRAKFPRWDSLGHRAVNRASIKIFQLLPPAEDMPGDCVSMPHYSTGTDKYFWWTAVFVVNFVVKRLTFVPFSQGQRQHWHRRRQLFPLCHSHFQLVVGCYPHWDASWHTLCSEHSDTHTCTDTNAYNFFPTSLDISTKQVWEEAIPSGLPPECFPLLHVVSFSLWTWNNTTTLVAIIYGL